MDLAAHYCPDRRSLEAEIWLRVGGLSALTGRLLDLVGKDHQTFIRARSACSEARADIIDFRRQLRTHRLAHGC